MVTQDEIVKLIAKAVPTAPSDGLQSDKPLTQQGFDSVDVSVLLFRVEEVYSVTIPTSEVGSLTSIGAIVDYLNGRNRN